MTAAFEVFVLAHIATGSVGLALFWVPVVSRKGSRLHRRWGQVFAYALLATGSFAIGMSLCTLAAPLETHPKLTDPAQVRGLFGWMMLYLAILTISLSWYGLLVLRNKGNHTRNRNWLNIAVQLSVIVAALNCAWQGYLIAQQLMMGIAIVGVASGLTNLFFIFNPKPGRQDYLKEHVKAHVGAGISVYTAFLAFGAARFMPAHAFNPIMWATPIVIGISLILYHHARIAKAGASREAAMAKVGSPI